MRLEIEKIILSQTVYLPVSICRPLCYWRTAAYRRSNQGLLSQYDGGTDSPKCRDIQLMSCHIVVQTNQCGLNTSFNQFSFFQGSGIFVTPSVVLQRSGSVGVALIIWTAAGILALLGKPN